MKKITDQEFINFLVNTPLYTKVVAAQNLTQNSSAYLSIFDFIDRSFSFLCPNEKSVQTFRTTFPKNTLPPPLSTHYIIEDPEHIPIYFNETTRRLDTVFHVAGECQSCKSHISFLIRTFSDKNWEERKKGINIHIQKVGQYPGYEIAINNMLKEYLSEEDQVNYKKALTCLSISYGIGAYSYFRRIIENEIKRIIKDISELEFDGVAYVKDAYNNYLKDFQMSKLIDIINKYLPKSLNELGDNPIRLLYEQLSGGIHEFSDEQCVAKAKNIDVLLNYVVKKINEEKYQLVDVKNAMKQLRK